MSAQMTSQANRRSEGSLLSSSEDWGRQMGLAQPYYHRVGQGGIFLNSVTV